MTIKNVFLTCLLALTALVGTNASAQENRNASKYNIEAGTGLKGFDPVAVFPEGGGIALEGKSEYRLDYMGVSYFFASAANLDQFVTNPEKYEPTYGGWCAYAMASGSLVDIQPQIFTIQGNRAHYFVSSRAKRTFDRDVLDHETRADRNWKRISGEAPRL